MKSSNNSRHLVDPDLLAFLDLLPAFNLSDKTLPLVRAGGVSLPFDPEIIAKVVATRHNIPGPPGAPDVALILYRPKAAFGALPAILNIHGGGYVAGEIGAFAGAHNAMSLDLNCVVAAVEYRLAPETPFPGPLEDCYAALAWLFANPLVAGVDVNHIGVMGESAGGGLAAALALLARDRGEYPLAFQHLISPMLDDRTSADASPQINPYAGEFLWTHHNNRYGWRAFLGAEPGSKDVCGYAAPARATSLADLPATFISTGGLDLFLEEDLDYARRLMREGVPVELHVYPGAFHTFEYAPEADVSGRARRDSRAALKRALHLASTAHPTSRLKKSHGAPDGG